MSCPLHEKKCVPCLSGTAPLKGKELKSLHAELPAGWEVVNEHHLRKEFKFKNFKQALAYTNVVGAIAEAEEHHPDIYLTWGKVTLEISTHKINGLTESDFILAAKCDQPSSFTA